MVTGAIFDLDGTLIDSMGVWRDVDIAFLRRHGLPVEDDYLLAMNRMNFAEGANYTIERYHLTQSPRQLMAEWDADARAAYAHTVPLKAGASEFLVWLRERGVRTAIATTCYPSLFLPTLQRFALTGYFDAIITSKDVSRSKDAPDVYLLAAERIGCAVRDCIVFEDHFLGLGTANAAGFSTVAVQDTESKCSARPRLTIKDYTDPRLHALFKE